MSNARAAELLAWLSARCTAILAETPAPIEPAELPGCPLRIQFAPGETCEFLGRPGGCGPGEPEGGV